MKLAPRTRKLVWSYLPDWLLTIVLAALFFSLDKVDGFRRDFSLSDTSLRHPFAVHERVPVCSPDRLIHELLGSYDPYSQNIALYFICIVAPILLQPVVNFITVRSWWDLHNSTLGLILSLSITGAITQFVKLTVGRPRPDVIDRCQPIQGSVDPLYGLSTWHICTQTDVTMLRDGFRSFPSGHASLSFAGLGFMGYYLAGKVHLFDKRGHTGKAWLSLAPFAAASLVAISRTMDYRHHWHDVLVGSILGIVMSFFAYRQYYPPLCSEASHKPYSPRIKREMEAILPVYHEQHRQSSTPTSQQDRPNTGRRYTNEPETYELTRTTKAPESQPLNNDWTNDGVADEVGNEYDKPPPAGMPGLT